MESEAHRRAQTSSSACGDRSWLLMVQVVAREEGRKLGAGHTNEEGAPDCGPTMPLAESGAE